MALLDLGSSPHGARLRLLPETRTEPPITPRVLLLHSIVGSAAGAYGYFLTGTTLESHLIVTLAGEVWQTMDTDRQADANYHANGFAVSVETEDAGDPDNQPWTPEQLDALVWVAAECHRLHGIPLELVPRWDGAGIGYHAMWGAPSPYTPVTGKTCPGRVRVGQFHDVLMPRVAGLAGGEDDMPSEEFFEFWFRRFEQVVKGQTGAIYNAANKHHGEAMEVAWREVNLTGAEGELLGRIHEVLEQQRQMMAANSQLLERIAELADQLAPDPGGATQVLPQVPDRSQ